MRRLLLLASAAVLVLSSLLLVQPTVQAEGPQRVHVTNLPEVQKVRGSVSVAEPIPHTRLEVRRAQVSPGSLGNQNTFTDAGTIDTAGFSAVSLALAGRSQGTLLNESSVGAILVPDVPEVLEVLRTHGIRQFAVGVHASVYPSESGVFNSEQVASGLGFPRYRVFFYNETTRTSEMTLYLYLQN